MECLASGLATKQSSEGEDGHVSTAEDSARQIGQHGSRGSLADSASVNQPQMVFLNYNENRPDTSLGNLTPKEFAEQAKQARKVAQDLGQNWGRSRPSMH